MSTNTCNKIKSYPQYERPRERLAFSGVDQLSDQELLAILLSTGNKEQSALELAGELLYLHRGITGLRDLTIDELTRQKGIGMAKATTILAAVELGRRISSHVAAVRPELRSSKVAGELMQAQMCGLDREHFVILLLNHRRELLRLETVSIGSLSQTTVHPREVFKPAIRHSASSIILAHNHPSGHCSPSQEDLSVTQRLVEAGQVIGIPVMDHLIIGEDSYYSFAENQMI